MMMVRIQFFKQPIVYRHNFAVSRAVACEFGCELPALEQTEGAGNAGRTMRPQPRVQNKKAHERSHHGHTGSPGIPCAMVLTVSFVLSPVTGLVCHRR
jgi:hypothetical protein